MQNGKSAGFTYIGLLIFMALAGIAMAGTGTLTSVQMQRENEVQLLFVGEQFRKAIESYYQSTPSAVKTLPESLDDLLEDRRFPKPQRHLRRIYLDPMTGKQDWELIKIGGRILGVHSKSTRVPKKRAGFPDQFKDFAKAKSYQEWQFTYLNTAQMPNTLPTSGSR